MPSDAVQEELDFRKKLQNLLTEHSRENVSGTPDHILANYLARCLDNYDQTLIERETWYGRSVKNNMKDS